METISARAPDYARHGGALPPAEEKPPAHGVGAIDLARRIIIQTALGRPLCARFTLHHLEDNRAVRQLVKRDCGRGAAALCRAVGHGWPVEGLRPQNRSHHCSELS